MEIVVIEKLKAYIDPLTPEEHEALEASILAEGCRDALVLWGDVLVDGHNRYGICKKHGLPFQTVQNTRFQSMDDVHLWMIDQHLGRRSVSDFQRGVLALRRREIMAERLAAEAAAAEAAASAAPDAASSTEEAPKGAKATLPSRDAIARAARLSSSQVGLIEKIQNDAAPEVVAAVKSGAISISAAAAVASLPEDEQRAAAMGGGSELKQAAKRVRDAKRKPKEKPPAEETIEEHEEKHELRLRIAALEAENEALRAELAELRESLGVDA
ncbi:pyruvate/2-oxoglutarate dehydrogenase complex dihydrolipoamide acyltransferase (E2) component [Luteibacter sp. Sphag1AF]|uniref:plasmid replication/partition related protein n=1 Tax=Luteibacter sp. Sphag1AF TaxID=2587031 RepID=UPI0016198BE6|nr:plasmid replication/partition related protein [Luteibacter sp. Sphag1AF]MBB3227832.1 pyruvate/2-oxoglutarate dehydrogenase complex dihydrolipoamide acyltransferase (E2) component [Luteibacter sp. Sphag1AF]